MILLIDNYDSFSYNLYHYLISLSNDVLVIRNDEFSVEEIKKLNPTHIIISPGPGHPHDAGVIEDVIKELTTTPILGVCLGHQAICEACGGDIRHARKIMHGKRDYISVDNNSTLFKGLDNKIYAARYHSLVGDNLPNELRVIAISDDDEIMAVEHISRPLYGVQFHPESIMTPDGYKILTNFLEA